jgi:hypothetical protein
MCPAFLCVVIPCDCRLASLLFTDSSPTCAPVINFKYSSHHLTAFRTFSTGHALYHHISDRIPSKQTFIMEFSNSLSLPIGRCMTSELNERNSVFFFFGSVIVFKMDPKTSVGWRGDGDGENKDADSVLIRKTSWQLAIWVHEIDGRIKWRWISGSQIVRFRCGCNWLRIVTKCGILFWYHSLLCFKFED